MLVARDHELVFLRAAIAIESLHHLELTRSVAILAVSDERAVDPHVERGREAFKTQAYAAACLETLQHGVVKAESATVDGDSAVLGKVGSRRISVSVPRHLDVDVGRWPQSLRFERRGDGQVARFLG